MTSAIIVPLDGSTLADEALLYAELLARASGGKLLLAQSVGATPHSGESETAAGDRACAAAEERLEALCAGLRARGVPAQPKVALTPPTVLLRDLVGAESVSLIVMATHGRSGPSRWVLGSVAEQIMRQTHVPTLLLTPRILAAGDPARLQRRILVPTDGSDVSERIFPVAKTLARQLGVPIALVHAVNPSDYYTVAETAPYAPALIHEAVTETSKTLSALAETWRSEGITADVRVEAGVPLKVIERAATERHTGWIAMASHGRGGLGGLVLGSTALAVLRRATVPVLIASGLSVDSARA